jgi:serine phosphatase RsbU (regulator of sigma subunit)
MLRGVEAVTDTALAHLDVEALIDVLLLRIRDQLAVDTATVLLIDSSGQELVATASVGLEAEVAQGVHLPVGRGYAGKIAASGKPLQLAKLEPSNILAELLVERGVCSVLGVPLITAGRVLGVLHVGTLRPRQFTDEETKVLEIAAERMAMATQVRMAQLDRATALALQRSLLPARHIALPSLQVAARYVPGARESVGGDWYDGFMLPSGHVGVVIGDVAGHGLHAAVVMGRIRSALRAYALESHDPADVLSRLDHKMSVFEVGAMATVIYAVIATTRDRVQVSVAGHPPPITALPGQPAKTLWIDPDLPLGVRAGSPRRVTETPLPRGASLVLYTDGLIERPGETWDTGIERLRTTVNAGTAETVCARVMSAMIGDKPPTDDVALLAITHDNPP